MAPPKLCAYSSRLFSATGGALHRDSANSAYGIHEGITHAHTGPSSAAASHRIAQDCRNLASPHTQWMVESRRTPRGPVERGTTGRGRLQVMDASGVGIGCPMPVLKRRWSSASDDARQRTGPFPLRGKIRHLGHYFSARAFLSPTLYIVLPGTTSSASTSGCILERSDSTWRWWNGRRWSTHDPEVGVVFHVHLQTARVARPTAATWRDRHSYIHITLPLLSYEISPLGSMLLTDQVIELYLVWSCATWPSDQG